MNETESGEAEEEEEDEEGRFDSAARASERVVREERWVVDGDGEEEGSVEGRRERESELRRDMEGMGDGRRVGAREGGRREGGGAFLGYPREEEEKSASVPYQELRDDKSSSLHVKST